MEKSNKALYLWWVAATTAGEFLGFAIPTLIGLFAAWFIPKIPLPTQGITLILLMILAGIGEGGVLGIAQALILKKYIKKFAFIKWVIYTAIAAAIAWLIGMLPSTFAINFAQIHPFILILCATPLILIFVLSIGTAQWLVLRDYSKNAHWWILANAIAWPIGVAVSILAIALVPDNSPTIVWILAGITGGILMGATVGAITGFSLTKLFPSN